MRRLTSDGFRRRFTNNNLLTYLYKQCTWGMGRLQRGVCDLLLQVAAVVLETLRPGGRQDVM